MKQVVFIDVLLMENFIMNYLLLYIINRFCKCRSQWWKLVLSSLFGAAYVIIVFFPGLKALYSLVIKFMVSMVMIVIAFAPKKLKSFLKMLILFYVEAFIIAGCIIGIFYLTRQDIGVFNGAFLLGKITPNYIIAGSLVAIVFVKFGFDFFENYHSGEKDRLEIQIIMNSKSCNVTALIDTGNSLRDPLTNTPVIVVYTKAILDILPDELSKSVTIEEGLDSIATEIAASNLKSRIRLIPYKALGTENGLLTGIRVDRVKINLNSCMKVIEGAVIALYNKPLSAEGDYEALAYPEILN